MWGSERPKLIENNKNGAGTLPGFTPGAGGWWPEYNNDGGPGKEAWWHGSGGPEKTQEKKDQNLPKQKTTRNKYTINKRHKYK